MSQQSVITNPIRPGFYPDPSIIRYEDAYYMVNSSFLYFPCIPISKSYDLVNWETVGHAIEDPTYIDLTIYGQGRGLWAPDISYSNGRFYIVATLRGDDDMELTHRQMIVYSDKPEGPYSKPVFIDEKGIDPSLFHDDDGRHYMLFNTSVKILPLTDDCLSASGPVRVLFDGCTKVKTEGPHLLKRNGYYYLIMAEGGTGDGHMITCARAKSLDGPFEECPHNPLLTQKDSSGYLQRSGHGKFFVGPDGEWYTLFLCSRKNGGKYSLLGRETALAKVAWNDAGWPIINEGLGPLREISVNYDVSLQPCQPMEIEFTKELPREVVTYNDLYLIRQTHIDCNVSLDLSICHESVNEYGMIFYYDINSYIKYGLNGSTVFIRIMNLEKSIKEETIKEVNIPDGTHDTILSVNTYGLKKVFYLSSSESKVTEIASISDCSLLCDEGLTLGKRFTGPMVGVFGYNQACNFIHKLTEHAL